MTTDRLFFGHTVTVTPLWPQIYWLFLGHTVTVTPLWPQIYWLFLGHTVTMTPLWPQIYWLFLGHTVTVTPLWPQIYWLFLGHTVTVKTNYVSNMQYCLPFWHCYCKRLCTLSSEIPVLGLCHEDYCLNVILSWEQTLCFCPDILAVNALYYKL